MWFQPWHLVSKEGKENKSNWTCQQPGWPSGQRKHPENTLSRGFWVIETIEGKTGSLSLFSEPRCVRCRWDSFQETLHSTVPHLRCAHDQQDPCPCKRPQSPLRIPGIPQRPSHPTPKERPKLKFTAGVWSKIAVPKVCCTLQIPGRFEKSPHPGCSLHPLNENVWGCKAGMGTV